MKLQMNKPIKIDQNYPVEKLVGKIILLMPHSKNDWRVVIFVSHIKDNKLFYYIARFNEKIFCWHMKNGEIYNDFDFEFKHPCFKKYFDTFSIYLI